MKKISKVRFDALASYTRLPTAFLHGAEVDWLESECGKILATIIRDHEDQDYSAMFFARDLKERYRWVEMTAFVETVDEAISLANNRFPILAENLDRERIQGDEKGKPVDFFTPIVKDDRLNKEFSLLSKNIEFSPAKGIIEQMMRWHVDADGNFVDQFQSVAFDARIWELYLFAMTQEVGLVADDKSAIPDFVLKGLAGKLAMEATTVNPSYTKEGKLIPTPPMTTQDEVKGYMEEYMPIRFASLLLSKFNKKYWLRENVKGLPLVFAIQDFHAPGSMSITRTALFTYLYGYKHDWKHDEKGNLIIIPKKIAIHRWGTKEVPSGFFNLAESENISAVISNPNATLSKFNRMGVVAGFGSKNVKLTRIGEVINPNSNSATPHSFSFLVNSPEYSESWIEGLDVYHNPNAIHPLSEDIFPGAAHHRLLPDGQILSTVPNWQPLSSRTLISVSDDN